MKSIERNFIFELVSVLILISVLFLHSSHIMASSPNDNLSESRRDNIGQENKKLTKDQNTSFNNRDTDVATPRDRDPSDTNADSDQSSSKEEPTRKEPTNPHAPSSGINDATTDTVQPSSTKSNPKY